MRFTSSSSPARHFLVIRSALSIGGVALRGAQGPAPAPARAAMYTEAQATAGESLYIGSRAPVATARRSLAVRRRRSPDRHSKPAGAIPRVTAADVFFIARMTMPPRASNTLTAQDHAAVFAYILKMNGFAAGRPR